MSTYITIPQAEGLFGIPSVRAYRWRSRGEILVRGHLGRHETFDVHDLKTLNEKANADKRSVAYA